MIRDLDSTIQTLFESQPPFDPTIDPPLSDPVPVISFDLPDADWRLSLEGPTVNFYLYDVRENRKIRTTEPIVQRSPDGTRAFRRQPPARIDCAYCITAWSPAASESVLEEHHMLSQVLTMLLQNRTIPAEMLVGTLENQIPPYPTVIASADGIKNQPEFWGALDQQLKPSLNYVVTLALILDEAPEELPLAVADVDIDTKQFGEDTD